MLIYGTALFNGDGVAEDPIRAYALVSRSAAQGLAPARETLGEMDRLIPLEQRQKGVILAKQLAGGGKQVATKRVGAAPPKASAPAPKAAAVAETVLSASATGAFRIQLGAFRDGASAQRLFAQLGSRLNGARMTLVPSGTMTRLQAGPSPTRGAATAACTALRPQPCFPVPAR